MNKPTTIGIDLAKEVFAVCVMDAHGVVIERRVMRRAAFERWAQEVPACTVAMEACGSAHHWGRFFGSRGHTVRLMAAEFVKPFRKSGKNDTNDAEAVAIASMQPTMRFVPVKTVEQQAVLTWHRARQGWIEERTALINRLRGLLAEFGITFGLNSERLLSALPKLVDDVRLPDAVRALLLEAREQFAALDARLARCNAEVGAHVRTSEPARRVQELLGVGPVTASAVVVTVPDATIFRNGRQFGAWIGITPRQNSSGGKTRLGRSSTRGDSYLRALLVQGARSALQIAQRARPDQLTRAQAWMTALAARRGYHVALVAIANKQARMLWAMLARGEHFDANAWQRNAHAEPIAATH